MNLEKLRKELTQDEGCINKIYKDHLGYPTFGIGHLITLTDPEYGQEIGTPVSESRVKEVFNQDISTTLNYCEKLYPDFYDLPEDAQRVIANMMFNLGLTGLSKFKNMKKAVDKRDWNKAADEMMDSKWYRQVTKRADRLVNRIRKLAEQKKAKIVELPLTHAMTMLECDCCQQTALNLYINDDFTCLAYRCIACDNAGYFHFDEGDEE